MTPMPDLVLPRPPAQAPAAGGSAQPVQARAFQPIGLEPRQISELLWSAFGGWSRESWGRRAPGVAGWRVRLYAVTCDGCYHYEPHSHRLVHAGAPAANAEPAAPLHLVYVVDRDPFRGSADEEHGTSPWPDTEGIVRNVERHCARAGLASRVQRVTDRTRLARTLGLARTQRIELVQSIGYPAPSDATH